MSKSREELIPITVYLKPSTVDRLNRISHYLSIRDNSEYNVEKVIKAALVDYLDLMEPLSEEEKSNLKSLIFSPRSEQEYALKNRFKEIMKQKGIKAVQIHRDTGISESNLSQVLNNKNQNMSLDYFLRIWIALDCPPIGDCLYRKDLKP